MDLKKICCFEETFMKVISDEDIVKLENEKIVYGGYYHDSHCGFDFLNISNDDMANLYIGSVTEYDDRVFLSYSITLSNGKLLEDRFWSNSVIPLMTMFDIWDWKKPREFSIKIKIGIYAGSGGEKWEWQNIFTDIEDFSPFCSQPTFHSKSMDDLKSLGMFSDVLLLCNDTKSIPAHRCILVGSPYFRALFGGQFSREDQRVVVIETDLESMEIVLSFLYSGRIEEDEVVNWPNLYEAASFYQIVNLSQHCELQMMTKVTKSIKDIKYLLKFAIHFHAHKLKRYLVSLTRIIQLKPSVWLVEQSLNSQSIVLA